MAGMKITPAIARDYVEGLELPSAPPGLEGAGDKNAPLDLSQFRTQAFVVGADVIAFQSGVTQERRQDIIQSSLLAQLVAKKRASPDDVEGWYNAYFDVLTHLGWVIQQQEFSIFNEDGKNLDAHKAILSIAGALLGSAPSALMIVKTALEALDASAADAPWITLFKQESQSANVGRFQISLAHAGENDDFLVSLMAFNLKASSRLTQVLIVKFRSNNAVLKHFAGTITIDSDVLAAVRKDVADKLRDFTLTFVQSLPDLKV